MFMSMSSFFSICSYDYLKRCAFRCSQDHRTIILKHKLTTEAATPLLSSSAILAILESLLP